MHLAEYTDDSSANAVYIVRRF